MLCLKYLQSLESPRQDVLELNRVYTLSYDHAVPRWVHVSTMMVCCAVLCLRRGYLQPGLALPLRSFAPPWLIEDDSLCTNQARRRPCIRNLRPGDTSKKLLDPYSRTKFLRFETLGRLLSLLKALRAAWSEWDVSRRPCSMMSRN